MNIKKKRMKELCDIFGYSFSSSSHLIGVKSPVFDNMEYFLNLYDSENDEDYIIKRECTIRKCYPAIRMNGKIYFAFTYSSGYSHENVIDVIQKYKIKGHINHVDNELELIKYFKQIRNMVKLAEKYQKEDIINHKKESLSGDFICDNI